MIISNERDFNPLPTIFIIKIKKMDGKNQKILSTFCESLSFLHRRWDLSSFTLCHSSAFLFFLYPLLLHTPMAITISASSSQIWIFFTKKKINLKGQLQREIKGKVQQSQGKEKSSGLLPRPKPEPLPKFNHCATFEPVSDSSDVIFGPWAWRCTCSKHKRGCWKAYICQAEMTKMEAKRTLPINEKKPIFVYPVLICSHRLQL